MNTKTNIILNGRHIQKFVQPCVLFLLLLMFSPASTKKVNMSRIEQWSNSVVKIVKSDYLWTIGHFSLHREKTGEYFESPVITSLQDDRFNLSIRMYPNGKRNPLYVSLFLVYRSEKLPKVNAAYRLSILNTTDQEINTVSNTVEFETGKEYGLENFINKQYILNSRNNIVANDQLVVYAEFNITTGLLSISGDCTIANYNARNHINDDFKKYFGNALFSDVVLNITNKRIRAHKIILSYQSKVFENSLRNRSYLDIPNFGFDVVQEAVRYLYTGKVDKLQSMPKGLLTFGNVYEIQNLKNLAQEIMCKTLNSTNAVEVLQFAESQSANYLKAKAIHYIIAHASKIIESNAFQTLKKEHPNLILDIFNVMAQKKFNW